MAEPKSNTVTVPESKAYQCKVNDGETSSETATTRESIFTFNIPTERETSAKMLSHSLSNPNPQNSIAKA